MPSFQINGPSGTGKSTIGLELEDRGYSVIDTDNSFGYYGNLKTEKPVIYPGIKKATAKWLEKNGWIWDRTKVEGQLDRAYGSEVFFCGGSLNEYDFYPRFTKIFRLVVSQEVLVERLSSRPSYDHTNNPVFIARMLRFLEKAEEEAIQNGMIVIDTTEHTVRESTDQILTIIHDD